MTVENGERTYQLKALTELWTGDTDGKSERFITTRACGSRFRDTSPESKPLVTTGLLGSIRWWLEVLVRGLDGHACDPSGTQCEGRKHCVVCELFGCTGWARKFRFEVLDEKGSTQAAQIEQELEHERNFGLRFTPLRPIRAEEWALLDATLHLIAGYGAIGGKTVFKPSDEPCRENKLHHKDFGLIDIVSSPPSVQAPHDDLKKYLSQWQKLDHGDFAWASLRHFWCVKERYLGRKNNDESTFNRVLGRQEAKKQGQDLLNPANERDQWLAGSQRVSKKVFSFKKPARTFGFVKPGVIKFEEMRERLEDVWGQDGWRFLAGDAILKELFRKGEEQA